MVKAARGSQETGWRVKGKQGSFSIFRKSQGRKLFQPIDYQFLPTIYKNIFFNFQLYLGTKINSLFLWRLFSLLRVCWWYWYLILVTASRGLIHYSTFPGKSQGTLLKNPDETLNIEVNDSLCHSFLYYKNIYAWLRLMSCKNCVWWRHHFHSRNFPNIKKWQKNIYFLIYDSVSNYHK